MSEQWYVEVFGSHTNNFFNRGFTRDLLKKRCSDGQVHDLISLEKSEILQAVLSKEDLHLTFNVFCEVGYARPKMVNLKRSVKGSKAYVAASRWLKTQMTQKTARS